MRHYRPMTPAARDGRAERKRAAAEAAGIPVRDDADCRLPISLDLRCVGGHELLLRPCRGRVAWTAWRVDTWDAVETAALKELLHRIADSLPRMMSPSARQ